MIKEYTIMGTPEAVIRTTKMKQRDQDAYTIRRLNYLTQLTNQHNEEPLLVGAWRVNATFVFPLQSTSYRRHTMYPTLLNLWRFFDDLAKGVIYEDGCIIHTMTLVKTYEHTEPKSVFLFQKEKS